MKNKKLTMSDAACDAITLLAETFGRFETERNRLINLQYTEPIATIVGTVGVRIVNAIYDTVVADIENQIIKKKGGKNASEK